ncbi:LGFP repeat-containing protein [Arthrobacter sp. RIT-PI-e]|uniref:LGFP repeat-containing protein n=1 Tax=Arthrobacter sp. RIT-PI-e TaxID=1681197 RepID=UPI0006762D56|nr:hypothetical protein [Arthrobacter sp. RIT-PI-e]
MTAVPEEPVTPVQEATTTPVEPADAAPTEVEEAPAAQDEITSFVPDLTWNPLDDPNSNARYGDDPGDHDHEHDHGSGAAAMSGLDDGGGLAAIAPRSGEYKITLVTVQLTGKTVADTDAINMTAARNSIDSANNYWRSASDGKISLRRVNEFRHKSAARITDSYSSIMDTVTRELKWQARPYESLVIFVPHKDLSYGGSWGILGGGFTDGPTSGRVIMPYPSALTNNVVTHEFGHVLGVHHANTLACNNGRQDVPRNGRSWGDGNCWSAEYGDVTDLMGYAQVSQPMINSLMWEYGGFGRGDEIQNLGKITNDRQVTLRPWAGRSANRAAKFTDPVSNEVYYLELRTPEGYDAATAVGGNRGVKIIKQDPVYGWDGNASAALTPNSRISGYGNKSLTWQAGQTFTTHAGTRVRIDSMDNGSAQIRVMAPGAAASPGVSAIAAAASRTPGLGATTTGVVCGLVRGGCYQKFQGGDIHWTSSTGAQPTKGGIRTAWGTTGYENGRLGYPTRAEECGLTGGGCYQRDENGGIHGTPAIGARPTRGGIRTAWGTTGYETGGLGSPTGSEAGGPAGGGCYQKFQAGDTHPAPGVGAHPTRAGIRTAWANTGYERGSLRSPTGGEVCGLVKGGCYQNFQGGAIPWAPGVGAHPPKGAIRTAWANTGYETGRLGYPTSSENCTTTTRCTQTYEGGTITWTPTTGATPRYNR